MDLCPSQSARQSRGLNQKSAGYPLTVFSTSPTPMAATSAGRPATTLQPSPTAEWTRRGEDLDLPGGKLAGLGGFIVLRGRLGEDQRLAVGDCGGEQVDQPLFDIGYARQSNTLYCDVQDVGRALLSEGSWR